MNMKLNYISCFYESLEYLETSIKELVADSAQRYLYYKKLIEYRLIYPSKLIFGSEYTDYSYDKINDILISNNQKGDVNNFPLYNYSDIIKIYDPIDLYSKFYKDNINNTINEHKSRLYLSDMILLAYSSNKTSYYDYENNIPIKN